MELSIPRSISGLVVEYIVAIDVTRVRFPANASYWRLYQQDGMPSHPVKGGLDSTTFLGHSKECPKLQPMSQMVRNIPPQSKDFQKDNFTP